MKRRKRYRNLVTLYKIQCTEPEMNMEEMVELISDVDDLGSGFHNAILEGNIDAIKYFTKETNYLINSPYWYLKPVNLAIYLHRHEILEILVNRDADVNMLSVSYFVNNSNYGYYTKEPPLFAACRLNDKTAVNILLNVPNLDIEQRNSEELTVLFVAAQFSILDIIELLLNRGAELNSIKHPIIGAITRDWVTARGIVHFFIRRGCILDPEAQYNLLRWAVNNADRESFCLLVSAGCKVKYNDEEWLSYENLPTLWQEDQSFCNWIESLRESPASLLNMTSCLIRTLLIKKNKFLLPDSIKKLNLPNALSNLLLFQN